MQLTHTGTIKADGHNVFRTEDGRWAVSFKGSHVGYCDMLSEVQPMIEAKREAVRARLASVEARAAERKAEREAQRAEVQAASKAD